MSNNECADMKNEEDRNCRAYVVLDVVENPNGSANVLVCTAGDNPGDPPVYFLIMNIRDGDDGVLYDVAVGFGAADDKVEWLREDEDIENYLEILDELIDDIMKG